MRRRSRYAPYLTLGIVLVILLPVLWSLPLHHGDYPYMWFAGHLVARGGSPYDAVAWIDAVARYGIGIGLSQILWVYPPWTAYLLAPFGALPYAEGTFALHLAYLVVGVGTVIALARSIAWRSRTSFTLALIVPTVTVGFVNSVRGGELSTFLLAGVALVAVGLGRESTLALVAGALIVAMKPHLFLVFAPTVLTLLILRRAWWDIAATTTALALLAVVSFLRHPEAVGVLVAAAQERVSGELPRLSTWSLGSGGALSSAMIIAAVAAICAVALRRSPADLRLGMTLSCALVLSFAVVPYWLPYDQLLLVPIVPVALALADRATGSRRALGLTTVIIAVVVVPWIAGLLDVGIDGLGATAVVPFVVSLLLAMPAPRAAGARPRVDEERGAFLRQMRP